MSKRDQKKYLAVVCIQCGMNFLDLIGVGLLGIIGAVSLRGVQSKAPGNLTANILRFFQLSNLKFQSQVAILVLFAVLVLITKTLVTIFFTRKTLFFLAARSAEISSTLISKSLSLNLLGLRKHSTGTMQYNVTAGVNAITLGVLGVFSTVLADVSLLIIVSIGVMAVDPIVAASAILLFSITGGILYLSTHKIARSIGSDITRMSIETDQKIIEILGGYRELFVRNRRYFYADSIAKIRKDFANTFAEQTFLPYISKYVIEMALILGAVGVAALQFITRDASHAIAGLAIFLAAGSRIAPALLRLQQSLVIIQGNLSAAKPSLDLLKELEIVDELEITTNRIESTHMDFVPELVVENLNFEFSKTSNFRLSDINLAAQPGQFIGIVGASGSGKSTVMDLMLGINEPSSGRVTISGLPPREAIVKWPGAIAYVPQDVFLTQDSIRSNLSLGFPDESVSDELIQKALDVAQLTNFVNQLPAGSDTKIGENGSQLSGGQKQRIGIARAFLTNPALLLLDEATSALDSSTELEISEAIENLKGKVTVIMIAHRLSTIRDADLILYFDCGRITARGTFSEVRSQVPQFDSQAKSLGL